jgi:chromosome segregation ATPase
MTNNHPGCLYEERFSTLEQEYAELKARMDNKKEDIQGINQELATDRQQQIELIEKVTEVTVILKAQQKQRKEQNDATDEKIQDLKDTVDSLQAELADTKEQLTDFVASQRSFRNTVAIGAPIIISLVVGVLFKFL